LFVFNNDSPSVQDLIVFRYRTERACDQNKNYQPKRANRDLQTPNLSPQLQKVIHPGLRCEWSFRRMTSKTVSPMDAVISGNPTIEAQSF
jgi:hypothetical protein